MVCRMGAATVYASCGSIFALDAVFCAMVLVALDTSGWGEATRGRVPELLAVMALACTSTRFLVFDTNTKISYSVEFVYGRLVAGDPDFYDWEWLAIFKKAMNFLDFVTLRSQVVDNRRDLNICFHALYDNVQISFFWQKKGVEGNLLISEVVGDTSMISDGLWDDADA